MQVSFKFHFFAVLDAIRDQASSCQSDACTIHDTHPVRLINSIGDNVALDRFEESGKALFVSATVRKIAQYFGYEEYRLASRKCGTGAGDARERKGRMHTKDLVFPVSNKKLTGISKPKIIIQRDTNNEHHLGDTVPPR